MMMKSEPRPRRALAAAFAGAVLVISIGCAGAGVAGDSVAQEFPVLGREGEPKAVSVREAYYFGDAGEMTATSDLVIVGTVRSAGPGRSLLFEGDDLYALTEVVIDVDEVLYGNSLGSTVTLEVDVLFTGFPGSPLPRWLRAGSQSLLFLKGQVDDEGTYVPVNTQGVYRIDPTEDDVIATVQSDEFADRMAKRGVADLRQDIADIVPRIESGEITPQRTLPRRP